METLEEAIRRLIKEQFGSVPKFAESIGVPTTSIYSALDRGMANTRTELTDKIYRRLNIDWNTAKLDDDFRELKVKDAYEPSFVYLPLYGEIAAGDPIDMTEISRSYPCPKQIAEKHPNSGWLRVEGDSYNRSIPNGCYALIDFDIKEPNEHEPFAVCVNGYKATIKRVKKLENGYELIPNSYDPTYLPIIYDYNKDDTDEVTIIGKVVYAAFPFDWEF